MIKIKIKALIVVFFLISFVVAQEFEIEEMEEIEEEYEEEFEEEYLEEEYVEEVVLIEDKAGTTPDSPFYFVDEVVEDINLAVRDGEDKADYALDVSEEKVAEAKLMADKNKSIETERALTRANNISQIIEQEVSPNLKKETNEKMEFIKDTLEDMEGKIPEDWGAIKSLIDRQKTQAEKNKIAADLAGKVGDLCERLAMQDYSLMEAEPRCDPDNAPDWLRNFIEDEIDEREEEAKRMLIDQITTCINDPRDCDCSMILVKSHQLECEESTALAVECEYEENMAACDELDGMGPPSPEGLPDFLQDIFEETFTELMEKKEKEMFDKFAPDECKEAGITTREECEDLMEELYGPPPEECLEDGAFIGEDECMAIMIEKYDIPDECIEDGKPIPEEECIEMMVPEPCKEAEAYTEEECKAIMEKEMGEMPGEMPEECIVDGEFIGQEECEELMKEKMGMREEEIPEECIVDGEFIGQEECEEIIGEKPEIPEKIKLPGIPGECMVEGEYVGQEKCQEIMGEEFEIPAEAVPTLPPEEIPTLPPEEREAPKEEIKREFVPIYPEKPEEVLVIGEKGAEIIPKEELEKIKDRARERAEEEIIIPDDVEELSKKIGELEKEKEEVGEIEEIEFEEEEEKEEEFEEELPEEEVEEEPEEEMPEEEEFEEE